MALTFNWWIGRFTAASRRRSDRLRRAARLTRELFTFLGMG
jgi:hypothetical protein